MKTLIVFTTHHGSTEKVAHMINNQSDEDILIVNLKKQPRPNLSSFDTIILGGSIHVGKIQGRMKKFIETNLQILLSKRVGLYLCCMEEGEKALGQFENAFPEVLRNHAIAGEILGGEFNFERMNFLEKKMIKNIAHINQSTSTLDENKIRKFTKDVLSRE